ncbi:MAG: DMT family transporter [Rhodospirillaceae bacterium]|nr:DMT family transporter [Rhodospirillaceae bacterium]
MFVLGALCIFVSMDTLVKFIIQHNPAPQIIWLRFFVHAALAAAVMLAMPQLRPLVRSRAPGRQILRSLLLLATTACFFLGLRWLKLADLVILTQASPVFVVAMAALILGEKVGPRRWLGVAVGFIGVVVIMKPGFGFQAASLFGLMAALLYAAYHIFTRSLAGADHTMTTFLWTPAAGALLMAPVALLTWEWPTTLDLTLMVFPGLIGGLGHLLLIMAFARSEASLLAPYFYGAIVLAVASGWLVFGEMPGASTFAGAGLVVAAGLYVWHRERQIAKSRGQVGPAMPRPLPLSQA